MKRRKDRKRICRNCGCRHAIFLIHGKARADDDHDLCQRCFDREFNRQRARRQAEAA